MESILLVKSVKDRELELIKRLIDRLEYLSADSTYAHRASGLRGTLLRHLERIEKDAGNSRVEQMELNQLMEEGFGILKLAAKEMRKSK